MSVPSSHLLARALALAALVAVLATAACGSTGSVQGASEAGTDAPSYGTPQDCAAAGGRCVLGSAANQCAKQGPANTCNCNPGCNPGGAFCCLAFVDGGR